MSIDRLPAVLIPMLGLVLAAGGGCGRSGPGYTMLPVEGVVTLEGEPLANAEVMFDSADGPRGFGLTDEAGRFTVTTRQFGLGLPAGNYRVFVSGSEKTRLARSGRAAQVATVYGESGVGRVTVTAGGKPLSFDLEARPKVGRKAAEDDGSGA